jgi:hypothetical protein
MYKFWLAFLLVFLFPRPICAVDLVIKDPIVNNLEISVSASLSASSNYYLQGLLRSQSSSKYFGETQNNKGNWVDYISSPEKEYIVSNFFATEIKDATWSGMIKLRFKVDDPSYFGPGLYDLKLRRFTGGSTSSAGESNTLTLSLLATLPTATPSPSPIPSPSPSPTATPLPTPTPTSTPTPKSPAPSVVLQEEVGSPPPVGTVAGESTEIDLSGYGTSPSPRIQSEILKPKLNYSRFRAALIVGTGFLLLAVTSFLTFRKIHAHKVPIDLLP